MHIDGSSSVQTPTISDAQVFLVVYHILINIEAYSTFSGDCSMHYFQSFHPSYLVL